MSDSRLRRIVFLLFFFSGACGLIYQIVWTRMMTIVFGITVYAVSTVLCSFMAGLALGSVFFGRMADRTRRPLMIYGLLEIGIGVFALFFPAIMGAIEPLFVLIYHKFYTGNYYLFSFLRFLVVFPVLLVPTFLMGGTFPIVSRFFVRGKGSLGKDVGFLYAINTSGAVAGTFAVGFIFLAYLGMWESIVIAAVINIVVGVISVLLGRHTITASDITERQTEAIDASIEADETGNLESFVPLNRRRMALVLVAIGLSGFASLGLEVLWTRVLVFHTHNTTYAFSAMLLAFLMGIALGSWVFGMIVHWIRRPLIWFAMLELGIGAWSIFSLFLVRHLPRVTEYLSERLTFNNWVEAVIIILAQVSLVLLVPTFLMGLTFPLATRLVTQSMNELGRKIGDVYGANTLGTVLGSFVVGFAFIPLFGVRNTFVIIAGLQALVAAGLLLGTADLESGKRWMGAGACVLFILIVQFGLPRDVISRGFAETLGAVKFYEEEVTDTVMVVDLFAGPRENRQPQKDLRMLVFADGRGTAGHPTTAENRFYAHLPMLIHPDPQDVLNICIGAGNTIGAFAQHERMKTLTAVDLSSGVVEANKYFETNYHVLEEPRDPRVTVAIEDGRNFLLGTERQFDVIHLEPPEFHTAGVAFLYTKEFYELVKKRLKPGGLISQWVNAAKLTADELRSVVATFHEVFPHGTNWQGPAHYSWNFIASDRPLQINIKRAMNILQSEPRVFESLRDIPMSVDYDLEDPLNFFSYLLMSEETIARYADKAPIITDNLTRIDYSNPKSSYSGYGFIHLYSPADMTKFFRLPPGAKPRTGTEPQGGWGTLLDLALKSDSVTSMIDWSGCTPEEQQQYELKLKEYQQQHRDRMQKYVDDMVAGWRKANL